MVGRPVWILGRDDVVGRGREDVIVGRRGKDVVGWRRQVDWRRQIIVDGWWWRQVVVDDGRRRQFDGLVVVLVVVLILRLYLDGGRVVDRYIHGWRRQVNRRGRQVDRRRGQPRTLLGWWIEGRRRRQVYVVQRGRWWQVDVAERGRWWQVESVQRGRRGKIAGQGRQVEGRNGERGKVEKRRGRRKGIAVEGRRGKETSAGVYVKCIGVSALVGELLLEQGLCVFESGLVALDLLLLDDHGFLHVLLATEQILEHLLILVEVFAVALVVVLLGRLRLFGLGVIDSQLLLPLLDSVEQLLIHQDIIYLITVYSSHCKLHHSTMQHF